MLKNSRYTALLKKTNTESCYLLDTPSHSAWYGVEGVQSGGPVGEERGRGGGGGRGKGKGKGKGKERGKEYPCDVDVIL